MRKKILGLVAIVLASLLAGRVWAAPAALPTPSATPGDELLNTIHDEVQKITATSTTPQNTGVVGKVSAISSVGDLIKITTAREGEKSASVSGQTTIFRLDSNNVRSVVKASDIKVGDGAIVIGQTGSGGVVIAKRIILYVPIVVNRLAIIGKVTKISTKEITVVTIGSKKSYDFSITTDTGVNQYSGSAGVLTAIGTTNIGNGKLVVVAGTQSGTNEAEASLVVELPTSSPLPAATP